VTAAPTHLPLPGSSSWEEWLGSRGNGELVRARELVDALKAAPPEGPLGTLEAWNAVQVALSNAAAVGSLLSEVHPEPGVRDRAEQVVQSAQQLSTDLGLDRELFAILAAVPADDLDPEAARVLDRTLRDFRRSGVDRDDATRERLRTLQAEAVDLGLEFSRNIREDVRTIRVRPEQLDGLPADWVEAHPPGEDGLAPVTTDYPDLVPFLQFAHDGGAREALMHEFQNMAWPANDDVLQRLLANRREQAALLEYASWPDYDAEVKMIGKGSAIIEFIDRIRDLSTESAERDKAVLLARKQQDDPSATDVGRPDVSYLRELVRKEQHEVDAQQVRRYFAFDTVRAGLLDVTGRLFGLTWTPVSNADAGTWHEDVASYDVDLEGERLGRIHLDLHPRDGKFKHAAQFTLVEGVDGVQLPEGVLVCNFSRGLMEHDDVVTLFHEFGHLVHHVVGGRQRWVRFSGVATEWDFVEAPSQMLEEWAWDHSVLSTFAKDEAGQGIPADLVARMRVAEDFGKGFDARTQMFYAAVSYQLHEREVADLTAEVVRLQQQYSVFPYLPDTHFQCSFGHLDGYGSGYYTYMWSLVIAKDLFSAFDPDDLFAPEVATAYRDKVLAPGGSRDAADLVADFLGRPYTFDAYARWLAT
jgi:thimet oligopeptidase